MFNSSFDHTQLETLSSVAWEEMGPDIHAEVAILRPEKLRFLFECAARQEPPNITLISAVSGMTRRPSYAHTLEEREIVLDFVKLGNDIDVYFAEQSANGS